MFFLHAILSEDEAINIRGKDFESPVVLEANIVLSLSRSIS